MRRAIFALTLLAAVGSASGARAVGLEGSAEATWRINIRVASGWDTVTGYASNGYPYTEAAVRAERSFRGVFIGGLFSVRGDLGNYDYALQTFTGGLHAGLAAQITAGYDGPRWHLSLGPWYYAEDRQGEGFHGAFLASILPFGVVRLRVGSLDADHWTLTLSDGAPLSAQGGAAIRFMEGLPVTPKRHRIAGGAYYNTWEKTGGVLFTEEFERPGNGSCVRTTWEIGVALGTSVTHFGRVEGSVLFGWALW